MNKIQTIIGISIFIILLIIAVKPTLTVEEFIKYYDQTIEVKNKQKEDKDKLEIMYSLMIHPTKNGMLRVVSEIKTVNGSVFTTNICEKVGVWDRPYQDGYLIQAYGCSNRGEYTWNSVIDLFERE